MLIKSDEGFEKKSGVFVTAGNVNAKEHKEAAKKQFFKLCLLSQPVMTPISPVLHAFYLLFGF